MMAASFSGIAGLQRLGLAVLEFFLPRRCLFCGAAVAPEEAAALCPECARRIEWVQSPLCSCCGRVFPARDGEDRVCSSCATDPPPFARARAAALYDGPVADAIKRFKFGRRLAYLPVMQHWLKQSPYLEMLAEADLVVPVPLHRRRLQARGFNQALLLARGLTAAPVALEALIRARHTVPQIGLNPKERRDNVKGAFQVPEPRTIKGKNILLVDDLFTTRATARECAKALLKAGAGRVEVFTVARVKHE